MRTLLLLALLLGAPGCILTSAANHLSDPRYPEQDASVAVVATWSVVVRISSLDGSGDVDRTVSFGTLGPLVSASVVRHWERTQGWSPVALFDSRERENRYSVSARDVDGQTGSNGMEPMIVPPSTGAKVASAVLLPFCFLIDLGTFPLEWLLYALSQR